MCFINNKLTFTVLFFYTKGKNLILFLLKNTQQYFKQSQLNFYVHKCLVDMSPFFNSHSHNFFETTRTRQLNRKGEYWILLRNRTEYLYYFLILFTLYSWEGALSSSHIYFHFLVKHSFNIFSCKSVQHSCEMYARMKNFAIYLQMKKRFRKDVFFWRIFLLIFSS